MCYRDVNSLNCSSNNRFEKIFKGIYFKHSFLRQYTPLKKKKKIPNKILSEHR